MKCPDTEVRAYSQRSDIMALTTSFFSSMYSNPKSTYSSSLFSSSMNSGMFGINFADYASIRNGSYHKLLRAHYSLEDRVSGKTDTSSKKEYKPVNTYDWRKKSTAISNDSAKKLAEIETDAKNLRTAADSLLAQGNKSLFKQTTTTDKEGNKTTGYDTDAIYKAVNNFVDQYNDAVKSAGDSKVVVIRSGANSLKDYTRSFSADLAEVGISLDAKTNTLSVDENKFKAADMNKVKSLFQGTTSYAYKVSSKAAAIDSHAQYEATKANTYNKVGSYSYNYSNGNAWNSTI